MDRILSTLLVAVIICGALINTNTFVSSTLSAYFGYTISVAVLCTATSARIWAVKKVPSVAKCQWLVLGLFFCWIAFYLLQPLLFHFSINLDHAYFIAHLFLLISLILLLGIGSLRASTVFLIIGSFAIAESGICILQLLGFIKSFNNFFSVTGSWVNPNVTAMFLAMSVPSILYTTLWDDRKKYRYIGCVAIVFLVAALVLLRCRAALFAVVIVMSIIFAYRFSLIQKVRKKLTLKRQIASIVLVCLMFVIAIMGSCYIKENSSAGRMLIWKLCVALGKEKALSGHGLGTFERSYNLYQASYFGSDIATSKEREIASYVRMAYCEPLQNFVEGGCIATLLFVAMLFAVLIKPPSKNNIDGIVAYAGIAGFSFMSFANFTVQAIPVMCLLIIYFAIYITSSFTKVNKISFIQMPIYMTLLVFGILFGIRQWKSATYYRSLQKITKLISTKGGGEVALFRIAFLKDKLADEYLFWRTYAKLLYDKHNYSESTIAIEKAIEITPDPELCVQAGRLYSKLQQYTLAEQKFVKAGNLQPYKMEPVMELMELYKKNGNFENARLEAQKILAMKPRGISSKAEEYKRVANELLKTDSITSRIPGVTNHQISN
jgi:O-antigen ligase